MCKQHVLTGIARLFHIDLERMGFIQPTLTHLTCIVMYKSNVLDLIKSLVTKADDAYIKICVKYVCLHKKYNRYHYLYNKQEAAYMWQRASQKSFSCRELGARANTIFLEIVLVNNEICCLESTARTSTENVCFLHAIRCALFQRFLYIVLQANSVYLQIDQNYDGDKEFVRRSKIPSMQHVSIFSSPTVKHTNYNTTQVFEQYTATH